MSRDITGTLPGTGSIQPALYQDTYTVLRMTWKLWCVPTENTGAIPGTGTVQGPLLYVFSWLIVSVFCIFDD